MKSLSTSLIPSLSLANLHTSLIFTAWICLSILAYRLYQTFVDRQSIQAQQASRSATLKSLKLANHRILHDDKGQQGEDAVYAAVLGICKALHIEAVTNRELQRPHAILFPGGEDVYSKEIDLILVSEIGIFVFEVKNWQGHWSAQSDDQRYLQCKRDNNQIESRPAPLAKTQGKLAQLLQQSGLEDVPAASLVVFTHPQASLDPHLPTNYLHISELLYFFRTKQAEMQQRCESWNVQGLFECISDCLDTSPLAMHNHMMRLSTTSPNLKSYQTNHHRIISLEHQSILTFKKHRPLRLWGLNAFFYIGLTLFVGIWV